MKKLIGLLLALTIISSCFALAGCGFIVPWNQTQMKFDYLRHFHNYKYIPDDVLIEFVAGRYNGYTVAMLDADDNDPERVVEDIGGVKFNYYDTNRITAYKDGVFYTLDELYQNGELSVSDLEKISKKANEEIGDYLKVCDKYDFPSAIISNKGIMSIDYNNNTTFHNLFISMDREWVKGNDTMFPIEYFGEEYIESIEIPYLVTAPHIITLVLNEKTKNNPRIIKKLVSELYNTPGIVMMSDGPIVPYEGSNTETNQNSAELNWGLENIEVEKVWDFTTGTNINIVNYVTLDVLPNNKKD